MYGFYYCLSTISFQTVFAILTISVSQSLCFNEIPLFLVAIVFVYFLNKQKETNSNID